MARGSTADLVAMTAAVASAMITLPLHKLPELAGVDVSRYGHGSRTGPVVSMQISAAAVRPRTAWDAVVAWVGALPGGRVEVDRYMDGTWLLAAVTDDLGGFPALVWVAMEAAEVPGPRGEGRAEHSPELLAEFAKRLGVEIPG